MPFGKELSHLIEEQINRVAEKNSSLASTAVVSGAGVDDGRLSLIEANLQRLGEQFASFLSTQKKSKRNLVDYGLEVIALHDMRVAITSGRAIFIDRDEPLDMPYSYLQLSNSGVAREIRYIYINSNGVVLESTTDPSNIGSDNIPLAIIDIWSNTTEITQDKIKDLRPRAGNDQSNKETAQVQTQLTGNVSLYSPDTGNDSFIVSACSPAGLKVNISSGRALVDGEIVDAEGGQLDLSSHRNVNKEFVAISDGVKTSYNLFHQSVNNTIVFVDNVVSQQVAVDTVNGVITFSTPPALGAKITTSYAFTGNYMLVFLVEKVQTSSGRSIGVIGWKVGSNRAYATPPELTQYQHAIAKIDMSSSINEITDEIIDNSYELINLTQIELQTGERLEGSSLKVGSITGNKIAAGTITGDKISAGSIDAASIKSGAIQSEHIAAGAITSMQIAANAITADMIKSGTITANKFEDATWGDLSQTMRFVKTVIGGEQSWRRALTNNDISVGTTISNVTVNSDSFPSIRLATTTRWDNGAQWDKGTWDIPVFTSGFWESLSIDYGTIENLQAEFWAQPLIDDKAVTITVKAKYSSDNSVWSEYETLKGNTVTGFRFWTGSLQPFRYFKVRVEFITNDASKIALLGYPEVRLANCQIGTEDISDESITLAKLSPSLRSKLGL